MQMLGSGCSKTQPSSRRIKRFGLVLFLMQNSLSFCFLLFLKNLKTVFQLRGEIWNMFFFSLLLNMHTFLVPSSYSNLYCFLCSNSFYKCARQVAVVQGLHFRNLSIYSISVSWRQQFVSWLCFCTVWLLRPFLHT